MCLDTMLPPNVQSLFNTYRRKQSQIRSVCEQTTLKFNKRTI